MSLLYFSPILIIIILILFWYFYDSRGQKKQIVMLSKLDALAIIDQQKEMKKNHVDDSNELYFKLIQAGLTKKEYNEGKLVFALIGIILAIALPVLFNTTIGVIGVVIGVLLLVFGGKLYIYISKAERVEKINSDLGTFLDLINVILEAGGGLKNAFFTVSVRAHGILNEEFFNT